LDVSLAFRLLLHLLAQVVQVVLQVTELAQKSRPLLRTFISLEHNSFQQLWRLGVGSHYGRLLSIPG
jgi:5-methylcytosine-specific restriction endonuclease McrBC regulatory subunit McrC